MAHCERLARQAEHYDIRIIRFVIVHELLQLRFFLQNRNEVVSLVFWHALLDPADHHAPDKSWNVLQDWKLIHHKFRMRSEIRQKLVCPCARRPLRSLAESKDEHGDLARSSVRKNDALSCETLPFNRRHSRGVLRHGRNKKPDETQELK